MTKEVCVFCGEEVSSFAVKAVVCGPTSQWACRNCAKAAEGFSEVEKCRRALQRSTAGSRERLAEFLEMAEGAEERRPRCFLCGEKLTFGKRVAMDPKYTAGILFVLPARCGGCGKLELFDPDVLAGNKTLAYLAAKDTGELR